MEVKGPTDASPAPIQSTQPARPAAHVAPARPIQQKPPAPVAKQTAAPTVEGTNVVFRRDANGQIYYVFTDSESGRELQELPPRVVRNVSQGIADLVKELQQKTANHIEVKG